MEGLHGGDRVVAVVGRRMQRQGKGFPKDAGSVKTMLIQDEEAVNKMWSRGLNQVL